MICKGRPLNKKARVARDRVFYIVRQSLVPTWIYVKMVDCESSMQMLSAILSLWMDDEDLNRP